MKKLFTQLFALVIIGTSLTSCMKNDDTDYEAENIKIEERVDAILLAEKLKIEEFVHNEYPLAVEDTVLMKYNYINKKTKRGIWYQELEKANEENEKAYTYEINANGSQVLYPKVKLKYTAKLLNGTIVQEDIDGSNYDLSVSNTNIIKNIWINAFFPYSIKFNGADIPVRGLTKNGLKKGSKFVVITPSYWAYGDKDATVNGKTIPASSSLVYEFTVLSIEK